MSYKYRKGDIVTVEFAVSRVDGDDRLLLSRQGYDAKGTRIADAEPTHPIWASCPDLKLVKAAPQPLVVGSTVQWKASDAAITRKVVALLEALPKSEPLAVIHNTYTDGTQTYLQVKQSDLTVLDNE